MMSLPTHSLTVEDIGRHTEFLYATLNLTANAITIVPLIYKQSIRDRGLKIMNSHGVMLPLSVRDNSQLE